MGKRAISFRLDEGLLRQVDEVRGDVSRTRFLERALEAAVNYRRPQGAASQEARQRVGLKQPGPSRESKQRVAQTPARKGAYHCPVEGCQEWARNPKSECRRHKVGLV